MKYIRELPLAHLSEKYLYKIEVAKSNAPAAAWARLSAQGILPSTFNSRPAVISTYTLCTVSGSLRMNVFKTKNTSSVFFQPVPGSQVVGIKKP